MEYDPMPICLYYGGKIITDSKGYNYEGQRQQVIHVNLKIKYHALKKKIYTITGWSKSLYVLGINVRWQASRGGNVCFVLIPVTDDESLRSAIRNTQGGKIDWSLVELYIEKISKSVSDSSSANEAIGTNVSNIKATTQFEIYPDLEIPLQDSSPLANDNVQLDEDVGDQNHIVNLRMKERTVSKYRQQI